MKSNSGRTKTNGRIKTPHLYIDNGYKGAGGINGYAWIGIDLDDNV